MSALHNPTYALLGLLISMSTGFAFKMEINIDKYNHVTIFVVRDCETFSKFPLVNKASRTANEDLNIIVKTHQHLLYTTWHITDSFHGFYSLHEISNFTLENPSLNVYSSEKVSCCSGNPRNSGTMTIIITQVKQVYSIGNHLFTYDLKYQYMWGIWLSYITGFRKVSLLKSNLAAFAISCFNPYRYLFVSNHNSLQTSPFLTLVFKVKYQLSSLRQKKLQSDIFMWVCYHCGSDYSYFQQKKFFKGDFMQELITNYDTQTWFTSEKKMFASFGSPILLVALSMDPDLGIEATRKLQPYTVKYIYLKYHLQTMPVHTQFFHPFALTLTELALKLNYTVIFGGRITKKWSGRYSQACIKQGSKHRKSTEIAHYPETYSLLAWDTSAYLISYIEHQTDYMTKQFFVILATPFDFGVWILLLTTLIAIAYYIIKLKHKPNIHRSTKYDDTIFEIIRLIFQKDVRRKYCVITLALLTFFFTEFFYLTSLTSDMIKPGKPRRMETLGELFKSGFHHQEPFLIRIKSTS